MVQEVKDNQSQDLATATVENQGAAETADAVAGLTGRELDALIAERVMGWEWPARKCEVCGWPLDGDVPQPCKPNNCAMRPRPTPTAIEKSMARYSTDIAAAMQVAEKMWQSGRQIEIASVHKLNTLITDNVRVWWVRFINNENDMDSWSAEADLLPEAICRAALEATNQHREAGTTDQDQIEG